MRRLVRVGLAASGRAVGRLWYDAHGQRESSAFEYDPAWLAAADGFALSPHLPRQAGPQFRAKSRDAAIFHGAIADAGPDGWARRVILRDHAKRRQEAAAPGQPAARSALDSLDFLLAVSDTARLGALRFVEGDGPWQRAEIAGQRSVPPLVELARLAQASRAFERQDESAGELAYLLGRATSLGGMRPKCTVADEAGRLCIGKFPSVGDERAVTKGEILALRLAADSGIRAARGRLVDCAGTPVAVIERFDRTAAQERLMYVSAATLLGVQTDGDREYAYTEVADAIRAHGANVAADLPELWRRIAFSILISNFDDHLHNHGFLHVAGGLWRLSPAFDLNPQPGRARELKTWISEPLGPEARIDHLLAVAPRFGLGRQQAVTVLRQVEAATARWREEGRKIGMTNGELEEFAEAFEHGERVRARQA